MNQSKSVTDPVTKLYQSNAQTSNIQQIWQMQNSIKECFNNDNNQDNNKDSCNINQKCIILVGATNVGKTTLLYYLNGLQLNLQQDQVTHIPQMQPKQIYKNAKIQNALSTTEMPNIYSSNESSKQKYSMIDMPGMNQKKFINIVSNVFTFDLVMNKLPAIKKVHLVLVIRQQFIDEQNLKQIFKQLTLYLDTQKLIESPEKYVSIIFTKTIDDQDYNLSRFVQILESLKQQVKEDEELLRLIEFLYQNFKVKLEERQNRQQKKQEKKKSISFYMFPQQQPIKQDGLKILEDILQNNYFFQLPNQNEESSNNLLHKNLTHNIFQNRRQDESTSFDSNFQSLSRSILTIQKYSLDMLIDISMILHTKLIGKKPDQQEPKKYIKSFSNNCLPFINQFMNNKYQQKKDYLKESEIQELLKTICSNIEETDSVCQFDKKIKQFLSLKTSSQNQSTQISLNNPQNKSSIAQTSKFLGQIYQNLVQIFNQIMDKQSRLKMRQSLKNVSKFFDWISQSWYKELQTINQIDKIKATIKQAEQEYMKYKTNACSILKQQRFGALKQKIIELSDKSPQDGGQGGGQSDQSERQDIRIKTVYKTQFKDVKAKYIQNNSNKIVQQLIVQTKQQITQDIPKTKYIQNVFQNISKKLIEWYTPKKEQNGETIKLENKIIDRIFGKEKQNNEQRLKQEKKILLIIMNVKHEQFLKNILTNFSFYLKFILEVSQVYGDNEQHKKILTKFIQNICEMLQQYSLYEQIILFSLLYFNFNQTQKYLRKGLAKNLLSQSFLKELIKIVKSTTQSYVINDQQLEITQQIIYHAYDHLKVQFCSNFQQIREYQQNCEKDISYIRNNSNFSLQKIQQNQYFQHNPYVVSSDYFNFQLIKSKMQIIKSRNYGESKIRVVYKKFSEKFKAKLNSTQ